MSKKRTRKDTIVVMLLRPRGATLEEMAKATGWQRHSLRAMISRLRAARGVRVKVSTRDDGRRAYHVVQRGKRN